MLLWPFLRELSAQLGRLARRLCVQSYLACVGRWQIDCRVLLYFFFFSFYLLISTTSSSYGQGVSRDEGSTGASGAVAWDCKGAIQAYGKR